MCLHAVAASRQAILGTTLRQAVRALRPKFPDLLLEQMLAFFNFRPVAGHKGLVFEFLERRSASAADEKT